MSAHEPLHTCDTGAAGSRGDGRDGNEQSDGEPQASSAERSAENERTDTSHERAESSHEEGAWDELAGQATRTPMIVLMMCAA